MKSHERPSPKNIAEIGFFLCSIINGLAFGAWIYRESEFARQVIVVSAFMWAIFAAIDLFFMPKEGRGYSDGRLYFHIGLSITIVVIFVFIAK